MTSLGTSEFEEEGLLLAGMSAPSPGTIAVGGADSKTDVLPSPTTFNADGVFTSTPLMVDGAVAGDGSTPN